MWRRATERSIPRMPSVSSSDNQPARVLVVDADRRVRASLEQLISVADDIACTGAVANAADALVLLESSGADAVLIDPRLPDIEIGLAFLQQAHRRGTRDLVPTSLQDGSVHFVSKSGQPDDLLAALRPQRAGIV
jgi:DNA-binding NarL/FixJ family response regulator